MGGCGGAACGGASGQPGAPDSLWPADTPHRLNERLQARLVRLDAHARCTWSSPLHSTAARVLCTPSGETTCLSVPLSRSDRKGVEGFSEVSCMPALSPLLLSCPCGSESPSLRMTGGLARWERTRLFMVLLWCCGSFKGQTHPSMCCGNFLWTSLLTHSVILKLQLCTIM